jgi:pyruvate formate lyase activating enzyme
MSPESKVPRTLAALFFILLIGTSVFFILTREKALTAERNEAATSHEARYYETVAKSTMVQCFLCPTRCVLSAGQWGACKARKNIGGKLYSMVYGKLPTVHVDPIEKKPLFHVLPGSLAFSIASTGCNMGCLFCQNSDISQCFPGDIPTETWTPDEVVRKALESGARSVAFTYNEPVINYEFVLETAKLAKSRGLKTVMISNGYIEEKPLRELLRYIDAYKVDLKAFNQDFYRKYTGGTLAAVLKSLKIIKESSVWLEIVTLLVPGENDRPEEIRALVKWIRENLGDSVPLHFSRFFPQYKLQSLPPTPPETIRRARQIALEEGLKFVYTGNIANPEGEATYCPGSKEQVIVRQGFFIISNNLKNGACQDGEKIPGIWN